MRLGNNKFVLFLCQEYPQSMAVVYLRPTSTSSLNLFGITAKICWDTNESEALQLKTHGEPATKEATHVREWGLCFKTVWIDPFYNETIWIETFCTELKKFRLKRFGLKQVGLKRFGLTHFGLKQFGLKHVGLETVRTSLHVFGMSWCILAPQKEELISSWQQFDVAIVNNSIPTNMKLPLQGFNSDNNDSNHHVPHDALDIPLNIYFPIILELDFWKKTKQTTSGSELWSELCCSHVGRLDHTWCCAATAVT